MRVIDAINVNDAFNQGIQMFLEEDTGAVASRAGACVELGPVTTVYSNPQERVLWDPHRDCNPFFHLFESLWMLAGCNDVEFLDRYNQRMKTFSDDGQVFHGAYGFRWRQFFGFDQIDELVKQLRADPGSRRAMLTMWCPNGDLIAAEGGAGGPTSKDLPCNLMIKFEIRGGVLNMIVFNRSNDMIWGAYGANAVHFSVLQEYMAAQLSVRMGKYWQVSGNMHVYTNVWEPLRMKVDNPLKLGAMDLYSGGEASPMPLFADADLIENDIRAFVLEKATDSGNNPFFDQIAYPLDDVWELWRIKDRARALVEIMKLNQKNDWVLACRLWMERRIVK